VRNLVYVVACTETSYDNELHPRPEERRVEGDWVLDSVALPFQAGTYQDDRFVAPDDFDRTIETTYTLVRRDGRE
jgi:hypothetical protein